ncbi:unnamed protein product (macronuclear) [Paramecium tetraurelia]|uniref:Uncharacterized protein n=1 Tax=Paramecium tetraurelia TaxID=5888 RepID=A0CIE6_PARTE|nr:uncharacterized protein GSPATT00007698001 [Paramecium tetraurelia]CAK70563.1 unnamed protein product [Paramecium tetraurelia]|eukprot:XP_001437960.1 hypothetical protein (macronuclear) [Paramecium tetraurelia strain d4-2]
MIRILSQKPQKKNSIVQKYTRKEIDKFYKLLYLLQDLENDLINLSDEFLVPQKGAAIEICKNKSTDKFDGKEISGKKSCTSKKPPLCQQEIQTLDEETNQFDLDILSSIKRDRKKLKQ